MSLRKMISISCLVVQLAVLEGGVALTQTSPTGGNEDNLPISTRWTLDAAGPIQRKAITSVFLLHCPKSGMKGTAFLIRGDIMVSAEHVVSGCNADDLQALSARNTIIRFSRLITDRVRDLALLLPTESLGYGLELGPNTNLPLGKSVTTWGFPLIYNGPAPLLSVGYVSGYYAATADGRNVRHVVVNAAFNPGNSGGPVFVSGEDKVIGIVIWKKIAFSKNVEEAIRGFRGGAPIIMGRFSRTRPDGTSVQISDEEVIADVLEEFYTKVQVHIGEAVAVSELRSFIGEHEAELQRAR